MKIIFPGYGIVTSELNVFSIRSIKIFISLILDTCHIISDSFLYINSKCSTKGFKTLFLRLIFRSLYAKLYLDNK